MGEGGEGGIKINNRLPNNLNELHTCIILTLKSFKNEEQTYLFRMLLISRSLKSSSFHTETNI